MLGLVHHQDSSSSSSKREKISRQDHKRCVSDDGPSTATSKERGGGGGGGRSGLSRTLGGRYRRGAALGEGVSSSSARKAASMDLPREDGEGEGGGYQQVSGEEGEGFRGGRFLERLLRRRERG
jgi:hypothetical protein